MGFYQRKLPHWQPKGAEYFITFRLASSLPKQVVEVLKEWRRELNDLSESDQERIQRKIFAKYEETLDKGSSSPVWLSKPAVAEIVQEALHHRDTKEYDLYAYCLMPNHVHLVFKHLYIDSSPKSFPITEIMRGLKRYTAYECNKVLNRKSAFWQSESYDRVIRNQDELERTIRYTLNNPVKAGFVENWQDWPYNYCKPEFRESFL